MFCAYNSLAHNAIYGNKGTPEHFAGYKRLLNQNQTIAADLNTLEGK